MRIFLSLPLIALLGGCAAGTPSESTLKFRASEAARLETALVGLTPGKPQSCIRTRDAGSTESYGDNILLFKVGKKLVYKNETSGSCRRVGDGNALITHSFSGDFCRGDIARSADLVAGFESGSCAFGDFVPYRGS